MGTGKGKVCMSEQGGTQVSLCICVCWNRVQGCVFEQVTLYDWNILSASSNRPLFHFLETKHYDVALRHILYVPQNKRYKKKLSLYDLL